MTLPRLSPFLDELSAYRPSEGVHAATRTLPLSANESPHTPLPGIAAAVAAAGQDVNRYPDPECRDLTRVLAGHLGVDPDRIVVGAGSVALLQTLFQAVAGPGAEAVYGWRSFEVYPVLAGLAGVRSVQVPLTGEAHDLTAMADRITDATRLVIVCNPNNPTGTVVSHDDLTAFLARVPPTCLVALDEAYAEYVRDPRSADGLAVAAHHPNVVVLRTFSKAYGLAALRVGYLVGDPRVVALLRRACLVYAVNSAAQTSAVAALGLRDALLERVESTVTERVRVRAALLAQGERVPDSQANFLWLRLGARAAAFGTWCADHGISVRVFPGEGVRVSVGSPDDNDAFVRVAGGFRARGRAVAPSGA
ncbi:histidinol-phosphate transaminase [Streptomyces sp. CWNU-52B]|uniref:histidinol-phosphate transaminase n=1 Tax=unclassified Streptomyces TaxID=2593676 RepID=UPI0039BF59EA